MRVQAKAESHTVRLEDELDRAFPHELMGGGRKIPADETRGDLTRQEDQIARLASEGLSNPEIGAKLFLSPRTVEWHLRHVYPKLGIASRRELRAALSR